MTGTTPPGHDDEPTEDWGPVFRMWCAAVIAGLLAGSVIIWAIWTALSAYLT